jgi:serine phosphatase RsbU (regulator of sigma subunit)/pSer/pThr/pTyr-binding forkhead associated (FHA) protein
MAVLRALQGFNPGQLFPIEGASVILGRHPGCDIVLESAAVSRQHARILNADGTFYLEDLHSRNGTFLNGRQVRQRALLSENDEVGICDLAFTFHLSAPELSVAPPATRRGNLATVAAVIDEDALPPSDRSHVVSKLSVPTHATGLRLEVNTEAKLKALIEISRHLGKALDLAEVLPRLLDSLLSIFPQADRGFIVLCDRRTGELVPKAVKHRRREDTQTIRISRTIVDSVMAAKEAILSADAVADARFDMSQSIVDFQIRSMMCAPLIDREGNSLGVIQLSTLDPRNRFGQEDLDVLVSVACQAAFAVENAELHELAVRDQAFQRELDVAHEVQCGFLPAAPPRIRGYEFFDFYEPASQLGGDYYDYVELPDGRLAVVVADVSGKGISASLVMAKLSAETRYCLASESNPAQAVARLNAAFCNSGGEDRFVTMAVAVLDPQRHEVTVVNAGHPAPLLRRGPGIVETVAEAETRLPLGVDRSVDYASCTLPLAPGESLTLYTDGITEAMNAADALYGSERLLAQLRAEGDCPSRLGRRILNDVKRFIGVHPQSDDVCLICFGRERE